ncbi:hypothetical protein Pmar_PMAR021760 [Perkinsus marinus ATCC 50983]|uniref:Uncharacterized protein n=1 Tax=Perkinsus marinus (strain ATCC 50983 / TXsc) TaxID=423536 RepID=C5LG03_PERM5|nr:hypothetical protein Pmar_PMAR021760 [Perkinsus marinus ATCC 50983]EER04258.1 hypothetical protein Pmar_PMAR021760 [Perkinsus marinus ATCC 50983]|eukprot:XP_002772442.1 hypothetical protein Pmar_PMAR021760 [Perkinsus marinus ATCC 50983]
MSVSEAISNPVVLPSLSESSEEVVGGLGETSAVVTSPNIPATLKENWPAVLKFTTSCVVRLDAERYHDLSPEDYHRLTFDEPRIIFDILAEELFPHVEGDSSLLHLKHL